jgi:hypothetical protein
MMSIRPTISAVAFDFWIHFYQKPRVLHLRYKKQASGYYLSIVVVILGLFLWIYIRFQKFLKIWKPMFSFIQDEHRGARQHSDTEITVTQPLLLSRCMHARHGVMVTCTPGMRRKSPTDLCLVRHFHGGQIRTWVSRCSGSGGATCTFLGQLTSQLSQKKPHSIIRAGPQRRHQVHLLTVPELL